MLGESIWDGVTIGGAGGAIAGVTVYLVQWLHTKWELFRDKKRVFQWLQANTSAEEGKKYRSTRAIASWTNLTEDRVRYVCSVDDRVFLSVGQREDMWSLHDRGDRSVYEDRGLHTV